MQMHKQELLAAAPLLLPPSCPHTYHTLAVTLTIILTLTRHLPQYLRPDGGGGLFDGGRHYGDFLASLVPLATSVADGLIGRMQATYTPEELKAFKRYMRMCEPGLRQRLEQAMQVGPGSDATGEAVCCACGPVCKRHGRHAPAHSRSFLTSVCTCDACMQAQAVEALRRSKLDDEGLAASGLDFFSYQVRFWSFPDLGTTFNRSH